MVLKDPLFMQVNNLHPALLKYLKKHNLKNKFNKQLKIFIENPKHPSLHTEILEPKFRKTYSFRIDKKYRVIFVFVQPGEIEIIDINDHYQ